MMQRLRARPALLRLLLLLPPSVLLLWSLHRPAQDISWLGSSLTSTVRSKGEPDFYACDLPTPCGPPGYRSPYLLDLLQNVRLPAQAVVERGRKPILLQIGVAGFSSPTRFTDLDLFNKTLSLLPSATRALSRLVLVEPNQFYLDSIREGIRPLGLADSQVQIVMGMVNDACALDDITMYRFSRRAEHDFGVPFSIYGSWLGTEPTLPVRALGGYSHGTGQQTLLKDKWLAFASAPNRTTYVEQVKVPCLTPAGLLAATKALMSDIAMVAIDAENSDYRIVDRFLDSARFIPGFLQFECAGVVWNETLQLQDLVLKLRQHGHWVGTTNGHGLNGSDEDNCIAVPKNMPKS